METRIVPMFTLSHIKQFQWTLKLRKKVDMAARWDLHIKLRGENLPIKDSWAQGGKADPYVVLRKGHGEVLLGKSSCLSASVWDQFEPPKPGKYMGEANTATWIYNGKNNYQSNTLDPKWPIIIAPLNELCDNSDFTKPIVIDIWDYDFECPNDDFMGFCHISIFEIFVAFLEKKAIPLQPGQDGHKWGGNLIVEGIELLPRENNSKLDPITPTSILHLVCSLGDTKKAQNLIGLRRDLVHEKTAISNFTPLQILLAGNQNKCSQLSPFYPNMGNVTAPENGNHADVVLLLVEANADVFGSGLCPLNLLAQACGDSVHIAAILIEQMKKIESKTTVHIESELQRQCNRLLANLNCRPC
jgi:hypothetical protein